MKREALEGGSGAEVAACIWNTPLVNRRFNGISLRFVLSLCALCVPSLRKGLANLLCNRIGAAWRLGRDWIGLHWGRIGVGLGLVGLGWVGLNWLRIGYGLGLGCDWGRVGVRLKLVFPTHARLWRMGIGAWLA